MLGWYFEKLIWKIVFKYNFFFLCRNKITFENWIIKNSFSSKKNECLVKLIKKVF